MLSKSNRLPTLVTKSQTVTENFYANVIDRVHVTRRRLELAENGWILHHDKK